MERWRCIFPKISEQQIEKFIKEYRGDCLVLSYSGEERQAIKESYLKNRGVVAKIMDDIIGVSYEDEDRIRDIIDEMIETKELKKAKGYVMESKKAKEKRRKAAKKEAEEAEKVLRKIEANEGTSDLKALIQKRQLDRGSFFDDLAAKYAQQPKAKKKKK
ncbi:unnamed protein product, partial [Anisakis simplex]|uniref:DnaJ homolog subfamily C member 9 (inferred by orthology to a human protein) n=1 Tax=Anisakis simplex TaxID=6269 RepID=A0A0M3JIP8_ANISI